MANSVGQISVTIWRDKDFRARTPEAQRMYMLLLSQRDLDRMGMQPLMVSQWSKGCDHTTIDDVWRALHELQEHRFVFFDEDTEELFIRSYARNSQVVKSPNLLKSALKSARLVESDFLRREVAVELRRLSRADADLVAEEIDPGPVARTLPEPFSNPSGTVSQPFPNPSANPQVEQFANPSGTLPISNPSGRVPEPLGVGEGVGELSLGSNSVGGSRAYAHAREDETPPSPHCPRHPGGTDAPCRACGDAKRARREWEAQRDLDAIAARSAAALERAELRARAILECELCDDEGYAGTAVCDHDPHTVERAQRGMAAVRAAIAKPKGAA